MYLTNYRSQLQIEGLLVLVIAVCLFLAMFVMVAGAQQVDKNADVSASTHAVASSSNPAAQTNSEALSGQVAPQAASQLNGSQASNQPQVQQRMLADQYTDWTYRCAQVESKDQKLVNKCEVSQIAQIKQGEQLTTVLTVAFSKPPQKKDQWLLTVLSPLNVFLPAGFRLGVDGGNPIAIEYRNCNQAGCWAQLLLSSKQLSRLKKGRNGFGRIQLMDGRNLRIKFSLSGLTKALNAAGSGELPQTVVGG